ncbi:hypothetical protein ACSSS7_003071 [Eimeria intestinalis]
MQDEPKTEEEEKWGGPRFCSELPPLLMEEGREVRVTQLVDLCREACAAILEVYRQPEEEWKLQHKEGLEPLTKADLESNRILMSGLRSLCPDSLLVSEESPHASPDARRSSEFVWLIDPLDGTKEFLKRTGEFAVNVGLCRWGAPVFGMVGAPLVGDIFVGGPSLGGAWIIRDGSMQLEPIHCRSFRWRDVGLRVTASSSHNSAETKHFIARLRSPTLIKAGSALKFVRLASGEADIYPRFTPCSEWDTCAPHAILRAAGGDIYRWEDASHGGPLGPLVYNKPNLLTPFFVAVGHLAEGEHDAPPPISAREGQQQYSKTQSST